MIINIPLQIDDATIQGQISKDYENGWGNAMQCDYCPNCGARLIGEEE